jgi:hypothetical protein
MNIEQGMSNIEVEERLCGHVAQQVILLLPSSLLARYSIFTS